jgi:hypothetical protein
VSLSMYIGATTHTCSKGLNLSKKSGLRIWICQSWILHFRLNICFVIMTFRQHRCGSWRTKMNSSHQRGEMSSWKKPFWSMLHDKFPNTWISYSGSQVRWPYHPCYHWTNRSDGWCCSWCLELKTLSLRHWHCKTNADLKFWQLYNF